MWQQLYEPRDNANLSALGCFAGAVLLAGADGTAAQGTDRRVTNGADLGGGVVAGVRHTEGQYRWRRAVGHRHGIFPIGFIVLMAVHALVRIDSRVA